MLKPNEQEDLFGEIVTASPTIERDQLAKALAAYFVGASLQDVVSIITNPYDELIAYMELTQGKKAGQKMSLLFNPHRLDCASARDKRYGSFYKALQDPDFHSGFARATIFRKGEMATRSCGEVFYMTAQIGVNGTVYANEFPPHAAKEICRNYRLNKDSHILDPCAGWGGRMIGVSVIADHYTCYEPSTLTAQGLKKLCGFIQTINPDFTASVNCQPYEDSTERANYYDLALTSPPYYDTEIYSDEDTNSCNRYKTFDDWCQGFYFPMVDKTMRQLKPGAAFVFNVGDRKYPLSKVLKEHCDTQGYTLRRGKNWIMNNNGFGRDLDDGEKFYEITDERKCEHGHGIKQPPYPTCDTPKDGWENWCNA